MALEPQQQFKQFLEKSKDVLILIPENPSADAVGSSWALYHYLTKKNIVPTIAFGNHLSSKFQFLPRPQNIISDISGSRDFVLSFDTSRNRISNIRHEEVDNKFNIYLTPEKGSVDPRDFSFILAKFKYDLVVVIDCLELEKLGALYAKNTDMFFEVPVVNIDHRSENDNFGQINLVDVTASSNSEILSDYIEKYDPSALDKTLATCLLTGLIGATSSFQQKNTTPKSLQLAASLMDKGADQQEIILWLYKTQPLNIIKLWGRAMAKINWDETAKLVWSDLDVADFVQSRASVNDLPLVLEKLEASYSEGKIFMAVYNDTPDTTIALIRAVGQETFKKIYLALGGEIKKNLMEVKFNNKNLAEVGEAIREKIKSI